MSGSGAIAVEGVVDARGPGALVAKSTTYVFVRLLRPDGELETLKQVTVPHELDAYMAVGSNVRFVYYEQSISKVRVNVIVGIRTGDRTQIISRDDDPAVYEIKTRLKKNNVNILTGVIGIPFLFIGVPILILSLMQRSSLKMQRPSDRDIRNAMGS